MSTLNSDDPADVIVRIEKRLDVMIEENQKLKAENRHLRETLKAALKRQRTYDNGVLKIVTILRECAGLEP